MFSDTSNGANASAYVYSIVETAKVNNVDIYHYLKYLMLETPINHTTDDKLERLCPWNPECKEAIEKLYAERQKELFDAM